MANPREGGYPTRSSPPPRRSAASRRTPRTRHFRNPTSAGSRPACALISSCWMEIRSQLRRARSPTSGSAPRGSTDMSSTPPTDPENQWRVSGESAQSRFVRNNRLCGAFPARTPLARDQVEPRADHYGAACERDRTGQHVPDDEIEQQAPEQRRVLERRDDRRGCTAEGLGDEVLGGRAQEPDADDQRQVREQHRSPDRQREQTSADAEEQREIEDQALLGLGARQRPERERAYGIADRGQHGGQTAERRPSGAGRAQHHQYSGQPGADRNPLSCGNLLAKQGHRKRRDEQRRAHEDRVGVSQRQPLDREDE